MFAPLCRRRRAMRCGARSIPSSLTSLAQCQALFFCLSFFCPGFCSSQLHIVRLIAHAKFSDFFLSLSALTPTPIFGQPKTAAPHCGAALLAHGMSRRGGITENFLKFYSVSCSNSVSQNFQIFFLTFAAQWPIAPPSFAPTGTRGGHPRVWPAGDKNKCRRRPAARLHPEPPISRGGRRRAAFH